MNSTNIQYYSCKNIKRNVNIQKFSIFLAKILGKSKINITPLNPFNFWPLSHNLFLFKHFSSSIHTAKIHSHTTSLLRLKGCLYLTVVDYYQLYSITAGLQYLYTYKLQKIAFFDELALTRQYPEYLQLLTIMSDIYSQ